MQVNNGGIMPGRILIVDDEIPVTRLISTVLGNDGHQTDVAHSCHDALTLIGQYPYDVIFIDIKLDRDQGGLALLKTATTITPTSRVIMMTGYPDVATATEAVRYGAFDYLCKPFDSLQISSITRHAIENRRLQLEREQFRANLEAINRSISDAIIMVDQRLQLQHLNDAALQCGYNPAQLGQPLDQLSTGCLGSCRMALAETVRTGQRHELKRIECRGTGNRTRIVSVIATPTTSEDGARTGAVAVIRDETRLDDLERQLQQRSRFHTIIGHAPVMQQLYTRIEALADVTSTVLICGESGTGKELVAQALHECGARKQKPFVKLNCSALPEGLLESELFGHIRGAFTGAIKDKMGRFQKAHGGTIFLDEIGDISPALQIRLLRVLQEREIERVGDTTPIKIDVRVIAATHRNLQDKVRRGEFRQDLYYRLNVVRLDTPPLRERLEDLPLLVEHFLHHFSHKFNRSCSSISDDVLAALHSHSWPGNVRELEHLIEHACILTQGSIITSEALPAEFFSIVQPGRSTTPAPQPRSALDLQEALRRTRGNRTEAAKLLGISRRTFYRWLEQQPDQ
ncbi:sigma-54 dependent transcriptional regulator [Trichlorobacter lovleyi]|uniref:sigma-54 dependent transcriptional regulator n=1 Tax=Trichlorobacter lovleyi TaxID=313985 RepID=UPI0023F28D31|nr:sigma-54-dependent Fis family transcriptional regulator [Trichlorobacter lovleyi]